MNRDELDKKLYSIRNKINKDNSLRMLDMLDEIFKAKPVTLLYFNVRAKVLCEMGKYEEAIKTLKFKINFCIFEEEYIESCKILQDAYKAIGMETFYRQWLCMGYYIRYILNQEEDSLSKVKCLEQKIIQSEDEFLVKHKNEQIELELANVYWESWYTLEATIMYALAIKKYNIDYEETTFFKERISLEINYIFLLDQLLYRSGPFVLIATKENFERIIVLAKAIRSLNQEVYVIMPPILAEVDKIVDINETVNISMENIEIDQDGIIKIRPVDICYSDDVVENNTQLIIEKILEGKKSDFSIVIADGKLFSSINQRTGVKKRMQRLAEFKGDFFEENLVFGYFGSYLSYISNIYLLDVKSEIEKPNECKFSIVIPVRNSSDTLRYTLQTCFEQIGVNEADYEIIISDNSSPHYVEVENLVKELKDSRIKYFRTPRELPLGKSFEYAFIKAKGEFVFSIGADDGVLPWTLKTIGEALKEFPNDDVFHWDRGFFVWSDNDRASGQAGQFIIPRAYKATDKKVKRYECLQQLSQILDNPNFIYGLPMLYINSGFRRRYIKKVLEDTGRLWDGGSQDIYMGVINLLINETIPYIELPITIAGMTSASIGIISSSGYSGNQDYVNRTCEYRSSYGSIVPYNKELNSICVSLDISLLYSSFFRALNSYEGKEIKWILNKIDLKNIFKLIVTRLNCNNFKFDYDIKSLRYSAYYNNAEFGEWFDNNILEIAYQPKSIKINNEKNYSEGFLENGGLQLDARKFNVTNIYEATKLFENICNL